MANRDQLLQTIEAIHEAGLDARRWPDALAAMVQTVGGVAATLEIFDSQTGALTELQSCGLPSPNDVTYFNHYFACNPRLPPLFDAAPGSILTDYMVLDEREMDGDEFYSDFLAPAGFRYFVGAVAAVSADQRILTSVQCATKQGHSDEAGVTQMQCLLPHIRQAYDVTQRLREAGETARTLETAFEFLADGVALVGSDGTVLYANEELQSIFREDDGLGISHDRRLVFPAPGTRRSFEKVFASICGIREGEIRTNDTMEFPAPRPSKASPFVVSLRPVFGRARWNGRSQPVAAIIFVRDPMRRNRASIELLRAMFGLTEAEAHVAQALQAAVPLADYAKAQGVSIYTVYAHLRSIKDKTHCRRQSELVRLLNDILLPLRRD